MLSAADFAPVTARRRRLAALVLGAATVAAAAPALVHQQPTPAGPAMRQPDTAATQATTLSPRVVVYSVPLPAKKSNHHAGKDHSGDSHISDDVQLKDNTGASLFAPQIFDGSGGRSTMRTSDGSHTTTITNGDGYTGSSSLPHPGADFGWTGYVPYPAPGQELWPPLQSIDGSAQPPSAPWLGQPSFSSPGPFVPTQLPQGPPPLYSRWSNNGMSGWPSDPASGMAAPVAQQLVRVQCPGSSAAGVMCFEATNRAGAAALTPSAGSLPNLPLVPSPGLGMPCSAGSSWIDSIIGGATGGDDGGYSDGWSNERGQSSHHGGGHHGLDSDDSDDDSGRHHAHDSAASLAPTLNACGLLSRASSIGRGGMNLSALLANSGEKIELTGYSFQDNQGGNNAKISCPELHSKAGGIGTFADPITVASGGSNGHNNSADGIKCGDRFYLPSVERYVIVEDTGNTANDRMPHLDMYMGDDPNNKCMNKISKKGVVAIPHPPPGLPVLAGPVGDGEGKCRLPDNARNGGWE